MKNLIRSIALILGTLICIVGKSQQSISPIFSGINAWMPTQVGSVNYGGQFTNIMTNTSLLKGSQPLRMMRYGGAAADLNGPTTAQLQQFITECRSMGAEPIIQIAFLKQWKLDNAPADPSSSANTIAPSVTALVNTLKVSPYFVKYWSIGNEPDLYGQFSPCTNMNSNQIAKYFRILSDAVKAGDANALVVGPDLASPWAQPNQYMEDFIGGAEDLTAISPNSNKPYLDIFAFHIYPFPHCLAYTGPNCTGGYSHTKNEVIGFPTTNQTNLTSFQQTLTNILNRINSSLNNNPNLRVAVTEINVAHENENGPTINGTNTKADASCNSFLAGQFLTEMYALCMNLASAKGRVEFITPWSVHENSGSNGPYDHGILDGASNFVPRSTYWHIKLMSDLFKSGTSFTSTFYKGTVVDNTSTPYGDIKSYAAKVGNQVVVILMNQKSSGSALNYEVRTNSGSFNTSAINAFFSTGLNHTRTGSINPQETQWIVFDCNGAYAGTWVYNMTNYLADAPPVFNTANAPAPFPLSFACNPPGCTQNPGLYLTATFTGAQTISWMPDGGIKTNNTTGTSTDLLSYSTNHQYSYIATNAAGCVYTQGLTSSAGIFIGTFFYAYICNSSAATCNQNNGAAQVCTGGCSGVVSYAWDNGATTFNVTNLSPGLHTVTVTCGTSVKILKVNILNQGSVPVVSAGPTQTSNRSCNVTLKATPDLISYGYTYKWYIGTSTSPFSSSPTTIVAPWSSTSYKVVMTAPASLGGCSNFANVQVNVVTPRCFPSSTFVVTNPCPPSNSSAKTSGPPIENINGAVTINSDQLIESTIKVHNNGILTIKECDLTFIEGTGIEVQPGGQLIVIGSWLHPCGGAPNWNGIVVKGNNNDPGQLFIEGSMISGATQLITTDKTRDIFLNDNTFMNATTALVLERNLDFKITKNYFYNVQTGIQTINTPIADVRSLIKENIFRDVKTAISFDNDNHSKLSVECNSFENYTDYAIYSDNTTLQDQGTISQGAANTFSSTSTMVNHKLRHNGNTMKYYYDPSLPMVLFTGSGMNAIAQIAAADGACVISSARTASMSAEQQTLINGIVDFAVYPNPFNNSITVLSGISEPSTIEIYNAVGALIYSKKMESEKTEINLDKYSSGIYFVRINNTKGSLIKKVVKQ